MPVTAIGVPARPLKCSNCLGIASWKLTKLRIRVSNNKGSVLLELFGNISCDFLQLVFHFLSNERMLFTDVNLFSRIIFNVVELPIFIITVFLKKMKKECSELSATCRNQSLGIITYHKVTFEF